MTPNIDWRGMGEVPKKEESSEIAYPIPFIFVFIMLAALSESHPVLRPNVAAKRFDM